MAWQLVAEVLDLPVPLTPAERLLLIALAERASAKTRTCWPPDDELRRRTGLSQRGLAAAFTRLAGRGMEVRVPVRPGATGRGAYSHTGRRKTYRLPEWSHSGATSQQSGRTQVPKVEALQCVPNHQNTNRHYNHENHQDTPSPASADAAAVHAENQDQRRRAEDGRGLTWERDRTALTVVAAYLAYLLLGREPDGREAGYLARTLHSDRHRDLVSFTRATARNFKAAPGAWTELAIMAADGNVLADEAPPLLREAREAAGRHVLSEHDTRACDALAGRSQRVAKDLLVLTDDGDWAEPTAQAAADAGAAMLRADARQWEGRRR
jgi:hypothetical protein